MKQRPDGQAGRVAAALALGVLLAAGPALAEEWHEAYRAGVAALARGDYARAAEALQRALAGHPEPGRNVVTYGTNVEPRYFPYLRLAEAWLGLGQLPAARQALARSAGWGREPAEERETLLARLDAAEQARRPPPPTAAPTPNPAPTIAAATPSAAAAVVVETPAPPTLASAPPPPSPLAATPRPAAARRSEPPATPPPPVGTLAPEPRAAALEIVSQPAGATAYIDDEPVGSTDPETGRLVKSGLAPGSHRVRVSSAGHEDVARDIVLAAGANATFYATLRNLPDAAPGVRASFVAFGVLAVALIAVLAWAMLRRPADAISIWEPTPRSGGAGLASVAPTPPGPLSPGARHDDQGVEWFGSFRLLGMLGRGGMASVYRAERRSELSALKRPLATFLEDQEFLERFLREAEIGRTLNHPNIVRILERGDVERVPYFTMELVPGETLQAKLRTWGAAEPAAAAAIVAQIAEALDFAHSKGVVHRDLKPSNVMLLLDGSTKVMDFGIARAKRFDGLTATGAFLGTVDYLAPETIEGHGAEPHSDLYALGVVFFELLTGRRPFSADTPFAILKKHCSEEPPAPSRIQPGVPPELEAIVLRLLRKRPAERPASAEELVVALRDWLNRAA